MAPDWGFVIRSKQLTKGSEVDKQDCVQGLMKENLSEVPWGIFLLVSQKNYSKSSSRNSFKNSHRCSLQQKQRDIFGKFSSNNLFQIFLPELQNHLNMHTKILPEVFPGNSPRIFPGKPPGVLPEVHQKMFPKVLSRIGLDIQAIFTKFSAWVLPEDIRKILPEEL